MEDGIVPGGGVVLLRPAAALEKVKLSGDEKTGSEIILRALEKPIRPFGGSGAAGQMIRIIAGLRQEEEQACLRPSRLS